MAEANSDDPADACSNSPSFAASPLPSPDVDDLIEAFSDSARSTFFIYSGSPESDSCSLASAFSNFPTHAHGSYYLSVNSCSPLHPTDKDTTTQINGNVNADDQQGSPHFDEH